MVAFIKGAIILATCILFWQLCSAKILYYSRANTTFARTVDDLYTLEFCGYSLAQRFTPTGLRMGSLPDDLKQRLRTFYERAKKQLKKPERINEFIWRNQMDNSSSSSENLLNLITIDFDMQLKRDVEGAIRLQLEEWSGTSRLKHIATYGIREYTRGAVLKPHVDQFRTHILSAVINVHQETDEPWPFVAFDHNNERHEIFLNDTVDVVLYESATVIHGRPYPLMGDSYANMFLHFAPIGWDRSVGDYIQACIYQTSRLCPDYGQNCASAKIGHYITDSSLIIDACDHNYERIALLKRDANRYRPL
uniref:Prolyl 4-hydroxylase alpha subunit domain-containing protein n=1 Tax=Plectus sambesii TaxID=2011161 RepID=A0A914VWC7_9BILA